MSVDLIKKPITLDEMTKKENVQVIKERDIIVPDGKPDLQTIVQLDGKVSIDQLDVTQDRITYRGKINMLILYTAPNNPNCIYTMKGAIPIDDFIIMEGVNKDQRIDFDYSIEHMGYNILNERKINTKAIMQLEARVTGSNETTIITDIDIDTAVQKREEQIEIVSLGSEKEDRVIVKEDLVVAQNKSSIGEILKTALQIKEEQVRRTETEIKYNGIIEVMTMYKANGDEQNLEIISHRIPFEGAIENIQNDSEVYWSCDLSVDPSYMQVTPDYDGEDRVIESEFIVTAKYAKYNKFVENMVCDLYCPGKKVSTKEKGIDYMTLVNRAEMAIPKKEAISIEGITGDNIEVFSVDIKPTVEEKLIENGTLTLRGMLEMKAVCVVSGETSSIETLINVVPFSQELDMDAVSDKAFVVPFISAKDINIYAQTRKELVVEYLLDCTAEVYTRNKLNILEEVSLEDMTKEELDKYPSMTVYQLKKNDSLWELAKHFNTTVKDIQEMNDLDMSDHLKEGQKIIILKKVKF